jgi:hypothetical protein
MSKKLWYIFGGVGVIIVLIIGFAFFSNYLEQRSSTSGLSYGQNTFIEPPGDFGLEMEEAGAPIAVEKRADNLAGEAADSTAVDIDGVDERLIVKTGSLSMVVEDVAAAIDKIQKYAEEKDGFVVSSNISKYGVAPTGNITVRIPVEVFDAGFEEVKDFGEVQEQSVTGQDVTEEYIDLDAQLNNLKATETQFLEIMKQAVKIQDILDVQRELTIIRGQIERIEGRMKYLRESAAMSTLTVYLSTDPSALPVIEDEDEWKPLGVIKDAFRALIEVAKFLANGIIWLVIFIPLWALIGLIVWLVRRKVRKKK